MTDVRIDFRHNLKQISVQFTSERGRFQGVESVTPLTGARLPWGRHLSKGDRDQTRCDRNFVVKRPQTPFCVGGP